MRLQLLLPGYLQGVLSFLVSPSCVFNSFSFLCFLNLVFYPFYFSLLESLTPPAYTLCFILFILASLFNWVGYFIHLPFLGNILGVLSHSFFPPWVIYWLFYPIQSTWCSILFILCPLTPPASTVGQDVSEIR